MTTAEREAIGEAEIRALIHDKAKAIRAKDSAAALSDYAPDVLSFDLIDPLQYTGAASVRERLDNWFSSFDGPVGYEVRDLDVTAGDDVAFSHSLNHVDARTRDGRRLEMWWRVTECYRKLNGRWLVTHSHSSVPFDVESGKASMGLKP